MTHGSLQCDYVPNWQDCKKSKLASLAALIGQRNFLSFAEIKLTLGISLAEAIVLKPGLERRLGVDITSIMTNPAGFFIEDR